MKKNIIIAIGLILLAGGFFAYKTYNKEHKNLQKINADYIISPASLLSEFEADENAAQSKYLNKIIQVQGELLEIQKVGDQTIWIISTGNPLSNIQCEMDNRYVKEANEKVKTGNTVTVQGLCSGKLMDIVLNQAVYKI